MATGLFEALRRYSPRENRDPLEDFITEGFAWLLNEYSEFGEFFLKYLEEKLKDEGKELNIGNYNCQWRTQENFDGKRPDMVYHFNGENKAIVFEHKTLGRDLDEGQLANYKEYACKNFDEYRIVLITATQQQHEQDPDLALCWSDIYNLISNWEERGNNELLIKDFQQLLKSVGLGPPAPISHTSIWYYCKYYDVVIDLQKNMHDLRNRVQARAEQKEEWKEMIKKDYNLSILIQRGRKYDYYGRIGLEILAYDDSQVGIFVGIIVDGEDHRIEPINPVKGPDFCLIISFYGSLYNFYPKKEAYKKLLAVLQKKVAHLNDGWEFYNHLDDHNEPNKQHPIYIRKPMLDVFCGTESCEDQEQRFYEVASKLIELVVKEESFWALKESLQKHLSQQ